jgi:hypothetical protein
MKGIRGYIMRIPSKRLRLGAAALTMVWFVGVGLAANGSSVMPRSFRSASSPVAQASRTRYVLSALSASGAFTPQGDQAPAKKVMVEDVFKNIQVLKGISVDEFMGTMGIMANSLGFCCNDCHNGARPAGWSRWSRPSTRRTSAAGRS